MKFKTAFLIITTVSLLMMPSCAEGGEETSPANESAPESKASQVSGDSKKEDIKAVSSSVSSPLESGVWGTAAKYSTSKQEYYDIPVRITGLMRGDKAKDKVKAFMEESDEYTYKEPDKGEEWVLAEYELCLDGFPLDEVGADCSIVSFVTDQDGGYIQSGGKSYNPVTVNITDGEYYFEQIHGGKIAFILPEHFKDYLIVLGEYEEDQAYFSVEQ